MNWIADIIIAALALAGTLGGAYFANRRSSALIAYRIQQLDQKVDKHNSVIERTYALEKQTELLEERLQTANRRIDDLETR